MSKTSLPKLIIASSDHDADMLYATGFFVPDPFIFLSFATARKSGGTRATSRARLRTAQSP